MLTCLNGKKFTNTQILMKLFVWLLLVVRQMLNTMSFVVLSLGERNCHDIIDYGIDRALMIYEIDMT